MGSRVQDSRGGSYQPVSPVVIDTLDVMDLIFAGETVVDTGMLSGEAKAWLVSEAERGDLMVGTVWRFSVPYTGFAMWDAEGWEDGE